MALKERIEKLEQTNDPKGVMLIIQLGPVSEEERKRAIVEARARGEGIVLIGEVAKGRENLAVGQ